MPQKPNAWRRMWTCPAHPQTSETLTFEATDRNAAAVHHHLIIEGKLLWIRRVSMGGGSLSLLLTNMSLACNATLLRLLRRDRAPCCWPCNYCHKFLIVFSVSPLTQDSELDMRRWKRIKNGDTVGWRKKPTTRHFVDHPPTRPSPYSLSY